MGTIVVAAAMFNEHPVRVRAEGRGMGTTPRLKLFKSPALYVSRTYTHVCGLPLRVVVLMSLPCSLLSRLIAHISSESKGSTYAGHRVPMMSIVTPVLPQSDSEVSSRYCPRPLLYTSAKKPTLSFDIDFGARLAFPCRVWSLC